MGFHAIGITAVRALDDEIERLDRWLLGNHHAGMEYLTNWREIRRHPGHAGMVEGARSILCVALAYSSEAPQRGLARHLSAFARGPDYHDEVRHRLRALLAELREVDPTIRGRALVDSAPVLERAWAVRCGLGFIGRNSCLIHPELGSLVVLGELIVTAELEPDPPLDSEGCGSCRACVEACPTGALARPEGRVLDARRCLSYWTVEAKEQLPAAVDAAGSKVLFGCDACQDVCPWNLQRACPDTPLRPLARWAEITLEDVATLPLDTLQTLLAGTPLERTGAESLRRRARILLRKLG